MNENIIIKEKRKKKKIKDGLPLFGGNKNTKNRFCKLMFDLDFDA